MESSSSIAGRFSFTDIEPTTGGSNGVLVDESVGLISAKQGSCRGAFVDSSSLYSEFGEEEPLACQALLLNRILSRRRNLHCSTLFTIFSCFVNTLLMLWNMNNLEHGWMYDRLDGRGAINYRFITGVNNFIQFACSQQNCMSGNNIRCPCKKCRNIKYKDVETVRYHLLHDGFVKDYFVWKHQGETDVIDVAGPNFNYGSSWQPNNNIESGSSYPYEPSIQEEHVSLIEEEPNLEYQKFYELLHSADAKLYPGSSLSQLTVISRMLNIKMENTMSQRGFNQMMQLFKEALPEDNLLVDSYYQTKKLVHSLGLPVEKIDCCESGYKFIDDGLLQEHNEIQEDDIEEEYETEETEKDEEEDFEEDTDSD
ncbi:putative flowering time control protein FCA-like isoform X1 [Capsicum annuum]|nr:putative flowering time control protein FCA-like isoform X1 [Capsicum annuum]